MKDERSVGSGEEEPLKAGAVLDAGLINGLSRNEEVEPVVTRVYVTRCSVPEAPEVQALVSLPASEAKGKISKERTGSNRPTVVVVDDERAVVNALMRELRSAGYEVEGFTDPLRAMGSLRRKDVLALITDYRMPGASGDQLAAQAQKENPDLPCIVLTGQATRESVIRMAKSARIMRVLTKPWNRSELLGALETIRSLQDAHAQEKRP